VHVCFRSVHAMVNHCNDFMLLIDIYVTGFDPIASGLLAVYCLHRQLLSKLE